MRSVTFEALWRDGPVNAQPGAPPGKKNPLGCGRVGRICPPTCITTTGRERQRTRRRFRGDAANAVSTDAAELAKVSLTSRLPFTSCQIKRWRGSGGLEAKRGIQSAFRCERKKDTSEPGRVNVLFVPPLLPVLLSLCRLC